MKEHAYRFVHGRTENYWWQRARRDLIADLLQRYKIEKISRWLDLGCGPAGNLQLPRRLGSTFIAAVDISPIAIAHAATTAPYADIVRADVSKPLPFVDSSFDIVTVLNVLYHTWIGNEIQVLSEVRRVLRPGGVAVLTEPAFRSLYREMDRLAMTRKRYRRSEFKALCRAAGFEVILENYFTSFGVPLIFVMKAFGWLFSRRSDRGATEDIDMKPLNPTINRAMYQIARMEGRAVAAGVPIPFGTTLVCFVRRDA